MGVNARLRRPPLWAAAAVLVLMGLTVAWMGQRAEAVASSQPGMVWRLSPASNTVTIRLTPGAGPLGRQVLAHSHLTVTGEGRRHVRAAPPDGGMVRVHVPPGRQTDLVVSVTGPQPFGRELTVTVPPRLRVTASRRGPHGLLVRASSPLRHRPNGALCGTDKITFPAAAEIAVAKSPYRCRTRLRLTAQDGEQAVL